MTWMGNRTTATAWRTWLLAVALVVVSAAWAQIADPRVYTRSYAIGSGPVRLLDTYLSQEHYSGTGYSFLATSESRRQRGDTLLRWSTLVEHQANFSNAHDRTDDTSVLEGSYRFFWGKLRQWGLWGDRLHLQAGGVVAANLGFIYNTLSGNNPAQARVGLQLMPTAAADYRFHIRRCRVTLRYELQLPLAGVMFSPNYGQSYYEIFSRGDYDHNIVPTTFVSAPDFRQQFSADVNFCRTYSLRLGYLGDYQQSDVNHLKSHVYSHRFMVGVVRKFQLIRYRP